MFMKNKGYLGILILFLWSTAVRAQREQHTLNEGWHFLKGDYAVVADSVWKEATWTPVHLPHTWNTDAYVRKEYEQGKGWYRRTFQIPDAWRDKQVYLKLEAASKAADVYVNGQSVGSHAGGYTAALYNLTPHLQPKGENVLLVQVDNARQDIPPISGDFTFFGGIYRDAWLTAVPAQHFTMTDHGSDGVFIQTPQVSDQQGTLAVRGQVANDASTPAQLEVVCEVYRPDGTLQQRMQQRLQLKPHTTRDFHLHSTPIPTPQLWTPETPHLYRVETTLRQARTHAVLDRLEHYTAFRYFHFDGRQGFFLNGKPYKLRGICRHQDQKPIGVALSDEMHRRDFRLMKEMGANFIRVSHYPQDEALLEMCDRQGMLVWEEIPIIDIVPDTSGYAETCERNLREMIRQHYNHPSVIAWGYMNEILLVTQRRYRREAELKPVLERTLALAQHLEQVLKEEDTTRVSTMAFHGSNAYNDCGLSRVTDVVGWNLYSGWYGGDLTGFERFVAEQQQRYPDHPLIVSEYGAGSDRRLHTFTPRPFDFSSEYQQVYLEHYLPILEETPYICGGTHWNFIDFSSALRDESMPRINNKGLVCADRTPKDVYYYYQAMWRKDIPVLHIAARDWPARSGVQRGNQPVVFPVKVYTNLPEVELWMEGKSLGRQRVANACATFQVPFTEAQPYLAAAGEFQGRTVHDGLRLRFTPVPDRWEEADARTLELAVNVGSHCFFTSDESGLTWVPDRPYTAGGWGYVGGTAKGTQTEIRQTADGPLYQTVREGIEAYCFDVPKGRYEVELLLAETEGNAAAVAYLLGKGTGNASAGSNRFAIRINDQLVEECVDLTRTVGPFTAWKRRYVVQHTGGCLSVNFQSLQGKTRLSAIKLRQQ